MEKKLYFPNLDGLRGIAVLLIVLLHVAAILTSFHFHGEMGVDLFFAISGFLICTLFIQERKKTGKTSLSTFFIRRISRLFPLYYSVLLLYCILIYGFHIYSEANRELFTFKLPSYTFFYSNLLLVGHSAPFFFAWSLAIEEQFYTAFGSLFRFVRRNAVIGIILFLWALKFVYRAGLIPGWELGLQTEKILFSYKECLLLGVLAAFFMDTTPGERFFSKLGDWKWVLGALSLWLFTVFCHDFATNPNWVVQLFYVFTVLLVGASVKCQPIALLSKGFFAHFGKISYGVYLCHMLYINTIKKVFHDPLVVLVLTVGAAIVVNTLIYRYFEVPVMHKIRNSGKGGRSRRVGVN